MENMAMRQCQFDNVYYRKRVLITGHTGFKGSWLSLWLSQLGAEVYGYALPPTTPSLFEEAKLHATLAGQELADIRNRDCLKAYVQQVKPEIIFHMAAQPLVNLSYERPAETYETNVMGTVNLLEAVRSTDSVRVCQIITSDKCYENREWVYAYRENDPMGGYDPYSNSKGCTELVVSSYRRSFFNPDKNHQHGVSLASVRAGNVIGGGDWANNRIIPDCVHALTLGVPIKIRNPNAIRPWQHVLEPLSGYLWLAAKQLQEPDVYGEGWNFGPYMNSNITVQQIVELVVDAWGGGSWYAQDVQCKPIHEASFLRLDINKASCQLGWTPIYTVGESVANTIAWYHAWHKCSENMRELTTRQIDEYVRKASEYGCCWGTKTKVS